MNVVKKLKAAAEKKTLLILTIVALCTGLLGSLLQIRQFRYEYITGFIDGPEMTVSIASNLLSYAGLVVMLVSILHFGTDKSEKIFAASLLTGVAVSVFSSCLLPIVTGSYFHPGALIVALLMSLPSLLLIIDIKKNHKYIKASCIAVTVMTALSLISMGIALIGLFAEGFLFYGASWFSSIKTTLVWIVTLLYFIKHIKVQHPVERETALNIEEQLQELKSSYEQGTISKEEYDAKRNRLLQDF